MHALSHFDYISKVIAKNVKCVCYFCARSIVTLWLPKDVFLWNCIFSIFTELYQNILILITIGEKLEKFYKYETLYL